MNLYYNNPMACDRDWTMGYDAPSHIATLQRRGSGDRAATDMLTLRNGLGRRQSPGPSGSLMSRPSSRSNETFCLRPATGLWDASRETALYLSNRPIHACKAGDAVRKHWGIENKQHYTRDVTLREDASRIRRNPGIFARLRSFAYNILRFNQSDSIAQDRYAAALGGLEALSDMNYYKER